MKPSRVSSIWSIGVAVALVLGCGVEASDELGSESHDLRRTKSFAILTATPNPVTVDQSYLLRGAGFLPGEGIHLGSGPDSYGCCGDFPVRADAEGGFEFSVLAPAKPGYLLYRAIVYNGRKLVTAAEVRVDVIAP